MDTATVDNAPMPVLVARIAAGDETAFAELDRRMRRELLRIAGHVTRNSTIAEEVVQETLLEVWRKADRFDARRGAVRSWIATIARCRAVDAIRAEERRTRTPPALRITHGLDAEIEAMGSRFVVESALDRLSGRQRRAIELAYFGDLTYRQVAERLDVPLPTVKTRIRDGMAAMRRSVQARA